MSARLRIAIGADHGGFELKEALRDHLRGKGFVVEDCGTHGKEAVDYPRYAHAVASLVAAGTYDVGIVVDGAGIGSAMAANKVPGILAAACNTEALAKNAREHNDANVLTLGAAHVDVEAAKRIADAFLGASCTVERHRRRVGMIRDIERGALSPAAPKGPAPVTVTPTDLSPEDVARIAERVRELLKSPAPEAPAPRLTPEQVAKLIDHTLLKPEATAADIERLCDEARKGGFTSVCVNPAWVSKAKGLLRGTSVKVCAVVGFPLGAQPPEIKTLEARRAIREGAGEIDMVVNIGALKGKDDALVLKDVRSVVEACRDGRALCKVILETALLTDEEKVRACQVAMKAGADFVKTSTGFSSGGATEADVALMARTVAPRRLGVKASGGIRTLADLQKMVAAGATRIGASASVKILEEARAASRA
ncbi:deoxyribose-phosphate aldolase [Acidobacteria bacterium ACD]|nr:MAG: deoxyribose-phosphate aldolase [Acidobacteriota bacterium]MCE7959134.1 deoxyribose-phosphate aldolase [Acidobacteria bacterium ACB2]MDL1949040.1 deoxyribose-phosphate aldolase [Acidobacteria bacterium ACD]